MERDAVHLWRVQLTPPFDEAVLSQDELERADRFQLAGLRDRYCAGRCALRTTLSRYLSIAPEAIVFQYNEHGKPLLAGCELDFNLSNAHDLMLLGVTHGRMIGVDLEKRGRKVESSSIAKRFFSTHEVSQLESLPVEDRGEAFLRGWVRKEAYVKALGTGISGGLDNFAVSLEDKHVTPLLWKAEPSEDDADWRFYDVNMGHAFLGCVAVTRNPCHLHIYDYPSPLTFQPAR